MINKEELYNKIMYGIEATSTCFYQQKVKEGYEYLDETLKCIALGVEYIVAQDVNNKVIGILLYAMKALEDRDTILLSDIILYDLKVEFQANKNLFI